MRLQLRASGTVARFIESKGTFRILRGPRGEGKTTGVYLDLLNDASHMDPSVLPLRTIVTRGTWADLNRTTMENLRELEGEGLPVRWLDQHREAKVLNWLHFFFLGMDTFTDLSKFQGFGAGRLWMEEPAPVVDAGSGAASVGLSVDVFGVGTTSLRQAGVEPRVIISMNPPDEDHWTLKLKDRLKALKRERPDLTTTLEVFDIASGENSHVTEEQRQIWRVGLELAGRGDLVARLIEGKVGFVQIGFPVTGEYSDDLHLAKKPLPILENVEIVRLTDFGLNPTVVWTQITPSGFWNILGCRVGDGIGMEQFVQTDWIPWERKFLETPAEWRFRDIGDPAGDHAEQSDSEASAVKTLGEYLGDTFFFEPGPVAPDARIQALKSILGGPTNRGRGRLQIDPDEAQPVRKALRGGMHWPKDGNGNPLHNWEAAKRKSGVHSHPFDALGYGAAVLFGAPSMYKRPPPPRRMREPMGKGDLAWMAT